MNKRLNKLNKEDNDNDIQSQMNSLMSSVHTFITIMEQLPDSPQFDLLVNPDTLDAILQQMPSNADNAQIQEVMETLRNQGPEELKETYLNGIKIFKKYFYDIVSLIDNPDQLQDAINELPIEFQPIIRGLLNGDFSPLKSRIQHETKLDPSIKKILLSLLDGNNAGAIEGIKQFLKENPEIVENIRKQLLTNIEILQLMNISEDIVKNKRAWSNMIDNTLDSVMKMYTAEADNTDEIGLKHRKSRVSSN
jgi:uncharacterized protein YneF (UPF0154 family)